jgi:hypothetical protein
MSAKVDEIGRDVDGPAGRLDERLSRPAMAIA